MRSIPIIDRDKSMISERSKLSLCQFLDLQPRPSLGVLLRKHGIDAEVLDLDSLAIFIQCAPPDQFHSLFSEVIRTRGDLRNQVAPRYRYDERWADLVLCLLLDGYKVGGGQLVAVDPTIEGAEPLSDDLTASLSESGLPQADKVIRMLDDSTAAFRRVPQDINACLAEARVALQTIATSIADARQQYHPGTYDGSKWGQVLAYLRTSGLITSEEEKGLSGVFGFVSPGAHEPFGPDDIEMARLGRSLAIGMIYFLVKRFGGSDH